MLRHPRFRESLRIEFASKNTDRSFDVARVMTVEWNPILEKTVITLMDRYGAFYYRYTDHDEKEVRTMVRQARKLLGLDPNDVLKTLRQTRRDNGGGSD